MKKIFFLPLIGAVLLCSTSANASVLNDSESFQVARAMKLIDAYDDGGPDAGSIVPYKARKRAVDDSGNEIPGKCDTSADCDPNEYCTTAKICKNLCEKSMTYPKRENCATMKTTPVCAIEGDTRTSYCACTATSWGSAWKCSKKGDKYQCEMCPAGEKCDCPDGKISNGKGQCVACNSDNDCAYNQYCTNAGKTTASCSVLNCSGSQYIANHKCNDCDSAMKGCTSCSSANSCDTCNIAYNLRKDKSGCELKECAKGETLNYTTGACEKCPEGATACTSSPDDPDPVSTDCEEGYTLVNGKCVKNDFDAECRRICGNNEFYYDRPGAKLKGKERVCTRYPASCGYSCTTGWDIRYLVDGTVYTCQTAIQTEQAEDKDADCRRICGNDGFYYDRPGAKLKGKERVCTRYPLSCGYDCTTGWNIDYLVNGTVYTCQTAIQKSTGCTGSPSKGDGGECEKACGKGFGELRSGDKLGGKERVCTKYPKAGGYGCTKGWDIKYLVDGLHTCQTAIMTDTPVRK